MTFEWPSAKAKEKVEELLGEQYQVLPPAVVSASWTWPTPPTFKKV